ncbi:hypothetical protein [Rhodococcus opacus]|uniref:hypothetical protein n=1 Tax=Rhodococcus opacus TaxID=37919 RepID=UPI0024BB06D9|nr:hypothetical protein [Rhodococcus opacus]MDJ0412827.1 hypothetical protein [Rhodococcus opacus]
MPCTGSGSSRDHRYDDVRLNAARAREVGDPNYSTVKCILAAAQAPTPNPLRLFLQSR